MNFSKPKYTLSGPDKEKIRHRVAAYIRREQEGVIAAYIFGSFEIKTQFSDIDLGLLLKRKLVEVLQFELEIEAHLERLAKYPIDVRVLNNAPNSFTQNVIRTGKLIVDKDPGFRAGFEGNVLKQYFDFAYFRRRYLSEVSRAAI